MRGVRAKQLRRYVRETYPFLNSEALYKRLPTGPIVMNELCIPGMYKVVKKEYKRRFRNGTL